MTSARTRGSRRRRSSRGQEPPAADGPFDARVPGSEVLAGAPGAAPAQGASGDAGGSDGADLNLRSDERATGERRSAAGLLAFLLFAWGQSLLVFDWLRRDVFEPSSRDHLLLLAPIFGGAAIAAVVAVAGRHRGARPVGGDLAHHLGLASGLLALAAVFLLRLGPDVRAANEAGAQRLAVAQLNEIAAALEVHRQQHGTYPIGIGVDSLASALVPELLPGDALAADPWEGRLRYQSMDDGTGYLLISTGRDGTMDQPFGVYSEMSDPALIVNDVVVRTGSAFTAAAARTGRRGAAEDAESSW